MADRHEFDILGVYMFDRLWRIADETPLMVSYILKNKLYIGIYELGKTSKVRFESPIIEHLCFLSEQEFYEVQE